MPDLGNDTKPSGIRGRIGYPGTVPATVTLLHPNHCDLEPEMKFRYLSAAALAMGLFAAQPVMAQSMTHEAAPKPSQPQPHKKKPKKKKKTTASAPAPAAQTQ